MCLPCVKRYFQLVQGNFFSLRLKLLRFSSFWACWFGSNQKLQFHNNSFSKIFCYGSFRYVLPYVKRYFDWHQWISFLLGPNYWFSCFWELQFERDQRSKFNNNFFWKLSCMCLPYVNRYFQPVKRNFSSLGL